MNIHKPVAVLHERAGNLDVFKLHNGRTFLMVGTAGGYLEISDWEARELHKWLGENLARDLSAEGQANQAQVSIQPGASAYAEEAPLKRGSGEAMAAARALHERALDYANQRSQEADIHLRTAANEYAWSAKKFSTG